jgi:hypothetical protein
MGKLNKVRTGFVVGVFFAVIHAVWALLVALIPNTLQKSIDWIFMVHFLESIWKITSFNFANALLLIAVTFVFGYIFGWVIALIWNKIQKK